MAFTKKLFTQAAVLFSCLFIIASALQAQDLSNIDFQNLRASELSDQQIQRIWDRAQSQGYSVSDLEQMALARGMQPSQVSALVRRLRQVRMQGGQNGQQQGQEGQQLRTVNQDLPQIPQDTTMLRKKSRIFGANLFRSDKITFTPSLNIPTPEDYQLGPGDELVIDITATIDPAYVGVMTNTVQVTPEPGATDPTPDDHQASVDTDVIAVADITVDKQLDGDGVIAGESVSWIVDIANPGPSDAPAVNVMDTVDPRLADVAWTCTAIDGASCPVPGGDGDLDLVVELPAGSAVEIVITGLLDAAATGTLANTAQASAQAPVDDPVDGNNNSTVSDVIQVVPDLALALFDPLDPFDPAGSIDLPYEVTVSNAGPSVAGEVTLELDTSPATVVSVPDDCTFAAGILDCAFGAFQPGETRLLSPVAMINLLGDLWSEDEPDWSRVLAEPGAKLHLYGKKHARPRRKMGHVNVLGSNADDALKRAQAILRDLGGDPGPRSPDGAAGAIRED